MLYPQRRHRDRPVSYQENRCYVTYADKSTSPALADNIDPPHNWNAVVQLVHKTGLTPESKTSFNAGGFYESSYNSSYLYSITQQYWIGTGVNVISWDIDTIYIGGTMTTLVSYADAHPHTLAHDSIITCALSSKITQSDYDDWAADGFVNDVAVIGKQKLIAILYDKADGYSIAVYPLGTAPITPCYRRLLPDYDWSIANDFVIVGFKTDALTLVYWTRIYPTGGGIYKLFFNDSYTSETRTQLGNTSYPYYIDTKTYSQTETPETIDGTSNITSTDAGNTIVDVFQHKNDFTVIYKRHGYSYSEVYSYRGSPNPDTVITKTVNRSETHDFYAAYIDWNTNTVIDPGKHIFHESATENKNATQTNGSYSGSISTTYSLETKLLYANYAKSLYVYRTIQSDVSSTLNGDSVTTESTERYRVVVDNKGVLSTLAEYNNTDSVTQSIQGDPTDAGNYNNSSVTYPVEWYYYFNTRHAAFDGKLLVCCYDLNDSDIQTLQSYRARPATLIYKSETEYLIHDYRVDYFDANSRFYPLTVTSMPKDGA